MDNPDRIPRRPGTSSSSTRRSSSRRRLGDDLGRLNRPGRPRWLGYLIGDTNPGDPSPLAQEAVRRGPDGRWDTVATRPTPRCTTAAAGPRGRPPSTSTARPAQGHPPQAVPRGPLGGRRGAVVRDVRRRPRHATAAEFDPAYPVHLAIDSGVHTGAVWFQVRPTVPTGRRRSPSSATTTPSTCRPSRTPAAILAKGAASSAAAGRPRRDRPGLQGARPASAPRCSASTSGPG
jgi:hypothetical protein